MVRIVQMPNFNRYDFVYFTNILLEWRIIIYEQSCMDHIKYLLFDNSLCTDLFQSQIIEILQELFLITENSNLCKGIVGLIKNIIQIHNSIQYH